MDKLTDVLKSLHPHADFSSERLVDDRILDSFDIITLTTELSDAFGVELGLEHLEPENFNSVGAIAALLRRLGASV
ncbi:MAG: acyl carrier protein [Oscillospiraceae bacterium]|jgi:acyl carrier protein|nr:acyl carrier protein [Oscillospiraceae bacterium]